MAREAGLFDSTKGDVVSAYFLVRKGGANIPESWIERSQESRQKRQSALGKVLRAKNLDAIDLMNDWYLAYRKECFYHGLRVLLDLQRQGKSNL